MFAPEYRNWLREELVEAARADKRITGAAVTGSSALGNEDAELGEQPVFSTE